MKPSTVDLFMEAKVFRAGRDSLGHGADFTCRSMHDSVYSDRSIK